MRIVFVHIFFFIIILFFLRLFAAGTTDARVRNKIYRHWPTATARRRRRRRVYVYLPIYYAVSVRVRADDDFATATAVLNIIQSLSGRRGERFIRERLVQLILDYRLSSRQNDTRSPPCRGHRHADTFLPFYTPVLLKSDRRGLTARREMINCLTLQRTS